MPLAEMIAYIHVTSNLVIVFALLLSLSEFRFSKGVTAVAVSFGFFVINLANYIIVYRLGELFAAKNFLFVSGFPCMFLFLILSKNHFFKAFFNFWTQMNLFFILIFISKWMAKPVENLLIVDVLIRCVLAVGVVVFAIKVIRKRYLLISTTLSQKWKLIAFVPFLFSMDFFVLEFYPRFVMFERAQALEIILLILTMFLAYLVIYITFKSTYDLQQKNCERQALAMQVDMQKKQYDIIRENIEKGKVYRHDFRHHLNTIYAYIENGEAEKAGEYIRNMTGKRAYKRKNYCDNHAVNTILSVHFGYAEEQGIQVDSKLDIPDKIGIEDMVLCVIFSNCLENAIEACEKLPSGEEKLIQVAGRIEKEQLIVKIKNSYDGHLKVSSGGEILTTKPGSSGLGLQSVRAAVERYGGVMDVSYSSQEFTVYIVLNEIK